MAGSVGVFGRHSEWVTEPISIPFASLRNFARSFRRGTAENGVISGVVPDETNRGPGIIGRAANSAFLTTPRPPILVGLAKKTTLNTVLSVLHGSSPLVIHVTGENLDQLAISTESQCDNIKSPYMGDIEFVLQLQDRIIGLISVGRSVSDGSCNILAISQFQVTVLKTATVEAKDLGEGNRVILEPKHQYDFQEKIISASALPRETVPMAVILTAPGMLYRWNAREGVTLSSRYPICDYKSLYPSDMNAPLPCVQYSQHPEICHVAACKNLFIRDFRQAEPLVLFSMESNYIVNTIQLSSNSGLTENYLFACMSGGKMLLVDKRFASRPLAQRGVTNDGMNLYRAAIGENFPSISSYGDKRLPGLIVGGSFSSVQSLLHSISITELCSDSSYAPFKSFYNACTNLGAGGSLAWDITGFPVVGRGLQMGSDEIGLSGVDILPLSKVMWQFTAPDLNAAAEANTLDRELDNEASLSCCMEIDGSRVRRVPYNALLLHQTLPTGDFFAQRVYIGAPAALRRLDESLSSATAYRTLPTSAPMHKTSSSFEGLSQQSTSSSQTLTQVFTYSQDGFALPQPPNWSSPPAARRGQNKRHRNGRREEEDQEKYATSPVLQCLPCGVRGFSCCELRNSNVSRAELIRNLKENANSDLNQLPLVASQVGNALMRAQLMKRFAQVKISVDNLGRRRPLPFSIDVTDIKTLTNVFDILSNELKDAFNEFGGFMSIFELGQFVLESPTGRRFLMSSAGRWYGGSKFYYKLRKDMQASHLVTSGVLEEHTLPVDVRSDLTRSPHCVQRGPMFDGVFVVPGRIPSAAAEETIEANWDIENVLEYRAIGDNVEAVCRCLVEVATKDSESSRRRVTADLNQSSKRKDKDLATFPCSLTSCVYLHLIGYRNTPKSVSKRRKLAQKLPEVSELGSYTVRQPTTAQPSSTDESVYNMDSIGDMLVPKVAPWRSEPIAPSTLVKMGVTPEDFLGSDISAIDVSFLKSEWEAD